MPSKTEPESFDSERSSAAPTGSSRGRVERSGLPHDPLGIFAHILYILVGGVMVFAFGWALVPAVEKQNEAPCRPLAPEDRDMQAPAWSVQDMAGNVVTSEDFAGKFVVLNFWATWCEPCITEWPELQQLAERVAGRDDVVVVALSVDEDKTAVGSFLRRMGLEDTPVSVLWDPEQKVHTAFGTTKLPDTYFVGPDGRIVHAFVNVRRWGSPGAAYCLQAAIEQANR